MFFKKSNRSVRDPDETVKLTPSIEAVIWREERQDGALDIRFGLNRVDSKGNSRRTFSPLHLSELAEGVAALCIAIGQAKGTEGNLAASLKELGAGIIKLLDSLKSNGPAVSVESNGSSLF